MMNEYKFSNWT